MRQRWRATWGTVVVLVVVALAPSMPTAGASFATQPSRILFMRDQANGHAAIFSMSATGKDVRRLSPGDRGSDADPR